MKTFWEGFLKAANERTDAEKAVGVGAATTGVLAGHHALRDIMRERRENKSTRPSKTWREFRKELQPGDVLFSRSNVKNKKLFTVKDYLQPGVGSPHYHAQVYIGDGKIFHHPGEGHVAQKNIAKVQLGRGEDVVAYRPNVSDKEKTRAIKDIPKALSKRPYKSGIATTAMGLKNLLVPGGAGKACHKTPSGKIVCTTVVSSSYPSLFRENTNIEEMRRNPKMKMVARLNRGAPPSLRERVLTRGVYPVVKNLKWGLGAGGLAYLGKRVHDAVQKPDT